MSFVSHHLLSSKNPKALYQKSLLMKCAVVLLLTALLQAGDSVAQVQSCCRGSCRFLCLHQQGLLHCHGFMERKREPLPSCKRAGEGSWAIYGAMVAYWGICLVFAAWGGQSFGIDNLAKGGSALVLPFLRCVVLKNSLSYLVWSTWTKMPRILEMSN